MKKRTLQNKNVIVSSPKRFYPEVYMTGEFILLLFSLFFFFSSIISSDRTGIFIMGLFVSIFLLTIFMIIAKALIIKLNKKENQITIKNYFATKLNLKIGIKKINLNEVAKNKRMFIRVLFHKYSNLKPIIEYTKKHFKGKVIIKYVPEIGMGYP